VRAHPAGPRHGEVGPDRSGNTRPADVNALDPKVWPRSATRGADGVLAVGDSRATDLVAAHGSPLFVLDEQDFRSRCRDFAEAFDGADVFYAAKAFLCRTVARWVDDEGHNLDVCTGGELVTALSAGFPAARIALHGNNKSLTELQRAVTAGVGRIVLDSAAEIGRLAGVAEQARVVVEVLIRVTVGVEAHTHEFIATAHEYQKFGFSLAGGDAAEAVRLVRTHPSLRLVGLHSHIGSQIFDTDGFEVSVHRLIELHAVIRDEHGVELPEMGLGGGLGIAYTSDDDPTDVTTVAKQLRDIVTRECAARGLAVPRLSVEPGRAIAGPGTVTLYRVGTVKTVVDRRTYVSVDGGMSDNIRTALYDADYTCVLASRVSNVAPIRVRVVGVHCESGDIVVRDAYLPGDIAAGDLLAVAATGAYCRSMASNYNHVPRPPVVSVHTGQSQVLLRRETEDDLLALDVG